MNHVSTLQEESLESTWKNMVWTAHIGHTETDGNGTKVMGRVVIILVVTAEGFKVLDISWNVEIPGPLKDQVKRRVQMVKILEIVSEHYANQRGYFEMD